MNNQIRLKPLNRGDRDEASTKAPTFRCFFPKLQKILDQLFVVIVTSVVQDGVSILVDVLVELFATRLALAKQILEYLQLVFVLQFARLVTEVAEDAGKSLKVRVE